MPAALAGILMKRMFAGNELTRRIMTLHRDVADMMYGCSSIYQAGKQEQLDLPLFYANMDKILCG